MDRYFIDERDGRYNLHDRRLGHGTSLGVFQDPEIAQRICALLNAAEVAKAERDDRRAYAQERDPSKDWTQA